MSSPAAVLRQDRTATLAFGLSFALLFGLSFGLSYIFTGVNIGGPDLGPVMGIRFGLSFGIAGGVAGAVTGWLAAGRVGVGAAAYGIASGIAIACVFPPAPSVIYGLAVGTMFGVRYRVPGHSAESVGGFRDQPSLAGSPLPAAVAADDVPG